MPDWLGITLGVIAVVLMLLPCRYDPAIWLKEWLDDNHETDDH
jgi:hypothetical protein